MWRLDQDIKHSSEHIRIAAVTPPRLAAMTMQRSEEVPRCLADFAHAIYYAYEDPTHAISKPSRRRHPRVAIAKCNQRQGVMKIPDLTLQHCLRPLIPAQSRQAPPPTPAPPLLSLHGRA
jgi:hypothetical protein